MPRDFHLFNTIFSLFCIYDFQYYVGYTMSRYKYGIGIPHVNCLIRCCARLKLNLKWQQATHNSSKLPYFYSNLGWMMLVNIGSSLFDT